MGNQKISDLYTDDKKTNYCSHANDDLNQLKTFMKNFVVRGNLQ